MPGAFVILLLLLLLLLLSLRIGRENKIRRLKVYLISLPIENYSLSLSLCHMLAISHTLPISFVSVFILWLPRIYDMAKYIEHSLWEYTKYIHITHSEYAKFESKLKMVASLLFQCVFTLNFRAGVSSLVVSLPLCSLSAAADFFLFDVSEEA